MPEQLKRFTYENGKILDGGFFLSEDGLDKYITRQQRAIENNKAQGPIGEKANAIIMKELQQALDVKTQIKNKTKKTSSIGELPAIQDFDFSDLFPDDA